MMKLFASCLLFLSANIVAQQLIDPTIPMGRDSDVQDDTLLPANGAFPVIKVSAIFYSADNQYAIVNGRTLKVGEGWGNITVIEIDDESVTLASGDVVKTFEIHSINIKQDIANVF